MFTFGRAAHSIYFQVLGDHGFVGLALYLGMLATAWWYAAAVRRRARRSDHLAWMADLAGMIQVSLVAFVVAGAGLSMAYYDLLYLLLGTVIALRQMVLQGAAQEQPRLAPVSAGAVRRAAPIA